MKVSSRSSRVRTVRSAMPIYAHFVSVPEFSSQVFSVFIFQSAMRTSSSWMVMKCEALLGCTFEYGAILIKITSPAQMSKKHKRACDSGFLSPEWVFQCLASLPSSKKKPPENRRQNQRMMKRSSPLRMVAWTIHCYLLSSSGEIVSEMVNICVSMLIISIINLMLL